MHTGKKGRAEDPEAILRREADEVLREAARLRSIFGTAAEEELVEMCILQLEALARKHCYLRRQAENLPGLRNEERMSV